MLQASNPNESSVDMVLANYRQLTAMQELVSDLSRNLVHCPAREVRSAMADGIARLGAFVKADRAYVFEFLANGPARNTHEWCAPGIKPEIENLQNLPGDMLDFWITSLTKGQAIHVPDVMVLDGERSLKRSFSQTRVFSRCWLSP